MNLTNCRFANLQLSSWGMPNRARDFTGARLRGCVFRSCNLEASACWGKQTSAPLRVTRGTGLRVR